MVIALFYTEALHGLPLAIAAGLSVVFTDNESNAGYAFGHLFGVGSIVMGGGA